MSNGFIKGACQAEAAVPRSPEEPELVFTAPQDGDRFTAVLQPTPALGSTQAELPLLRWALQAAMERAEQNPAVRAPGAAPPSAFSPVPSPSTAALQPGIYTSQQQEDTKLRRKTEIAKLTGDCLSEDRVVSALRPGCGIPAARAAARGRAAAHRRQHRAAHSGERTLPALWCSEMGGFCFISKSALPYRPGSRAHTPASPSTFPNEAGRSSSRQRTFYQPADVARTVAACNIQAWPAQLAAPRRTRGARVNTPTPLLPGSKHLGVAK